MLGPIEAHQKVFRDWNVFSGRSTRAEYWWPVPTMIVLSICASFTDIFVFDKKMAEAEFSIWPATDVFAVVSGLFLMSLSARRFQDVGMPGGLAIIATLALIFLPYFDLGRSSVVTMTFPFLITLAVSLGMLVVGVLPSQSGANQFGPNPHDPSMDVFA